MAAGFTATLLTAFLAAGGAALLAGALRALEDDFVGEDFASDDLDFATVFLVFEAALAMAFNSPQSEEKWGRYTPR
ncbi:hypothetical protein [Rhodopseudomonas sp. B29]|uniref:hypothetical protein n=1 Tax=Rhodopseudomonas sp. B29 TaxID=95607 RepID=UPI001FCA8DCB|nr:hypothetical protein [Rhodopseudomonas sp. B29]